MTNILTLGPHPVHAMRMKHTNKGNGGRGIGPMELQEESESGHECRQQHS